MGNGLHKQQARVLPQSLLGAAPWRPALGVPCAPGSWGGTVLSTQRPVIHYLPRVTLASTFPLSDGIWHQLFFHFQQEQTGMIRYFVMGGGLELIRLGKYFPLITRGRTHGIRQEGGGRWGGGLLCLAPLV